MLLQETKIERLTSQLGRSLTSEMALGSVPITRIADQVGTPFYAYNGDVILSQCDRVSSALGVDGTLYYSLKANPSLGVCELIAGRGVGAEVASSGELLLAQRAGFPAAKTIFAGPGKTDEELELAIKLEIGSINIESFGELERIARIAGDVGKIARVGIRINPVDQVQGSQMRMGGSSIQFGIDEEELANIITWASRHRHLKVVGLHVYAGTQIFDADAAIANCNHIVDLAIRMADLLDQPLEMIDFGGGFGIPYFENSQEFDLDAFSDGFRQIVRRCKTNPFLQNAELILELGRYLVAQSGIYVTRIVDVKRSRDHIFLVTDGGMNHHMAATGNFGQVFRKPYPIALLNRLDAVETEDPVTIAGPCCTPMDIIAQNIPFPAVRAGDLIGIFYSGAYGYSASSIGFLSHPTPAEVLVWDSETFVLRDPGTAEKVLDGQRGLRR